MARAKAQKYDNLSTSELARLTRDLGLDKPTVLNAGEWAAWLRDQEGQSAKPVAFADMTVDELKAYAADNDIDLHGAKKRDAIIAALTESK